MDKESADPDRVLNELTTKQIVPEEWGGDVPIAKSFCTQRTRY